MYYNTIFETPPRLNVFCIWNQSIVSIWLACVWNKMARFCCWCIKKFCAQLMMVLVADVCAWLHGTNPSENSFRFLILEAFQDLIITEEHDTGSRTNIMQGNNFVFWTYWQLRKKHFWYFLTPLTLTFYYIEFVDGSCDIKNTNIQSKFGQIQNIHSLQLSHTHWGNTNQRKSRVMRNNPTGFWIRMQQARFRN